MLLVTVWFQRASSPLEPVEGQVLRLGVDAATATDAPWPPPALSRASQTVSASVFVLLNC